MTELALNLLLPLVHQHHPEGLGPGQVQLQLQLGEDELLLGVVQLGVFLDTPGLDQVVTKFGKTENTTKSNSQLPVEDGGGKHIAVTQNTF